MRINDKDLEQELSWVRFCLKNKYFNGNFPWFFLNKKNNI